MVHAKDYLNKNVQVVMDRPLGSKHPKHGFEYLTNYGYIPNTVSGDGEELDALDLKKSSVVHTIVRPNNFVDVWLVHQDFDVMQIKKQEEEVSEVKWANIEEISALIKNNLFTPSVLE